MYFVEDYNYEICSVISNFLIS